MKTRTALFWRWLAENRGETADRVIATAVRAPVGRVALTPAHAATAEPRTGAEALTA